MRSGSACWQRGPAGACASNTELRTSSNGGEEELPRGGVASRAKEAAHDVAARPLGRHTFTNTGRERGPCVWCRGTERGFHAFGGYEGVRQHSRWQSAPDSGAAVRSIRDFLFLRFVCPRTPRLLLACSAGVYGRVPRRGSRCRTHLRRRAAPQSERRRMQWKVSPCGSAVAFAALPLTLRSISLFFVSVAARERRV